MYQHVDSSTSSIHLAYCTVSCCGHNVRRVIGLVILRCRLYHTLHTVKWVTRQFWHKLVLSQNLQFAQRAKIAARKLSQDGRCAGRNSNRSWKVNMAVLWPNWAGSISNEFQKRSQFLSCIQVIDKSVDYNCHE
jgi:hypothetical protein